MKLRVIVRGGQTRGLSAGGDGGHVVLRGHCAGGLVLLQRTVVQTGVGDLRRAGHVRGVGRRLRRIELIELEPLRQLYWRGGGERSCKGPALVLVPQSLRPVDWREVPPCPVVLTLPLLSGHTFTGVGGQIYSQQIKLSNSKRATTDLEKNQQGSGQLQYKYIQDMYIQEIYLQFNPKCCLCSIF